MATKRQYPDFRRREAQAMTTECQSADFREKEAQAKAAKRQFADYREKQAQAMATKHQCARFKEKEAHAKKPHLIKQRSTPCSLLQASQAFIMATKDGPHYTCVCCNRLMYQKTVIEFKAIKAPDDGTPGQLVTKLPDCVLGVLDINKFSDLIRYHSVLVCMTFDCHQLVCRSLPS